MEKSNNNNELELNIDPELEELRKQFIVDENEVTKENIKKHVKKILEFCRITSDGKVILNKIKITQKNKIGIVVMARYLGNKINGRILDTITPAELAEITNIARNNVRSLVGTLIEEGFVSRSEEGVYRFNPTQIEFFFEQIK